MQKTKFAETQIISMLDQYEKGVKVVDIFRESGISQPECAASRHAGAADTPQNRVSVGVRARG
jgi:hypothetical protein